MDTARGGHYVSVPQKYPTKAIYHYNDKTCDYGCQGTEFLYWAITSLLGGQDKRARSNMNEWEASTPSDLRSKARGMYNLLAKKKENDIYFCSRDSSWNGLAYWCCWHL
mmetsp:Transcript_10249/g.22753  ORF Transcript_10249/g.22753 Transcript_10249/m.22753 type:complete len:109 (+) Transcript_10249:31-357(+)